MPNPNLRAEALHSSVCLAGFLFQRKNWLPLTEHHSCRTPSCAWFLSWYSTFLELAGEHNRLCVCVCSWVHMQSCLTLCNPMDCSLPGSPVHGIFQSRRLEWVSISFSRGSSRDQSRVSCVGRQILYYCATWKALLDISVQTHRTSQVVLVVKNLPANAGDIRDEGLTPG